MTDEHMSTTTGQSTQAGSSTGSLASEIKEATTQKFDEAVQGVRSQANGAKTEAASEINDVASALRHASEEMREGSAQERTLGQIASSLADASDAVRDKDLAEISRNVEKVARDNPILFLGGAALLGFAASRYAKASGDHASPSGAQGLQSAQGTPRSMTPPAQVKDFVDEGNPNTQPATTRPSPTQPMTTQRGGIDK